VLNVLKIFNYRLVVIIIIITIIKAYLENTLFSVTDGLLAKFGNQIAKNC